MAFTTSALATQHDTSAVRTTQAIELSISLMETRINSDGNQEFHIWGKLPDDRQGRALFTVPGQFGCDVLHAVHEQLRRAKHVSARGRWINKNVAPGKNVWTFRIEIIDGISLEPRKR